MSNIARFKSGQTPEYLTSVHTPDYEGDPDVLVNPDISAVQSIDRKYWKRVGNTIVEMTLAEKAQIDLAEKTVRITAINNYEFEGGRLAEGLVSAGLITKIQIVNFIKGKEGL